MPKGSMSVMDSHADLCFTGTFGIWRRSINTITASPCWHVTHPRDQYRFGMGIGGIEVVYGRSLR